jgi:hypothetical protein
MATVPLQYSKAPQHSAKRVILISLIVILLLGGCWMLATWLGPLLGDRIPFMRRQSACLSWLGPPGEIAYTEDPVEAQQLSGGHAAGPGFSTLSDANGQIEDFFAIPTQLDLNRMLYPPPNMLFANGKQAVLFLHRRQAQGQESRLVCVQVNFFFPVRSDLAYVRHSPQAPSLECTVARIATLRVAPVILENFDWGNPLLDETTPKPTRIFFGQPDPADASRFSIRFETPTQAHLIQVHLRSDDLLDFQIVPATAGVQTTSSSR